MITTIRRQFKQSTHRYIMIFLVLIIALSMVLSLFMRYDKSGQSATHEQWAIRVNNDSISYKTLTQEIEKQANYLMHIKAQYGPYAEMLFQSLGLAFDPKSRAMDTLIKQSLVHQYAKDLGIIISSDYITKIFNNPSYSKKYLSHIIPTELYGKSGLIDQQMLHTFLSRNGTTNREFEKTVYNTLVDQQLFDYIATACYVPAFDAKQEYIAQKASKEFSYVLFSLADYVNKAKKTPVTDEQLQSFFDAQNTKNRQYWTSETRDGIIWKFEPQNYNITITDEQVQAYYESHKTKDYVLEPLKVEVKKIVLENVAQKENMTIEAVKQALLVDKTNSFQSYWTTLKPFSRANHNSELEKQAFLLQKEGDMSPAFETQDGTVVVQLVQRIARTYKPLVTVKSDIINTLVGNTFKKEFVKDMKKVILSKDSSAIKNFIKEKAGKKQAVSNVAQEGSLLADQLFALKIDNYGFYIDNGVGVAVKLSRITEKYLPDLASIKETVKSDYYQKEAQKALHADVKKAYDQSATTSLTQIATMYKASLHKTGMIDPNDQKTLQELYKQGLPVYSLVQIDKEGLTFVSHQDDKSMIIRSDAIATINEQDFKNSLKEIKKQLKNKRAGLLTDGAIASLHRNATIETDESMLISGNDYSE